MNDLAGAVSFTLNRRRYREGADPRVTVLDYLREVRGLTGTKEGCAEGDCGACTILTASGDGGSCEAAAVNSCLMLLPQLDGKAVLTVEGLADADGGLHPLQRALVDSHGSQCGFCTPGFVMSLYALAARGGPDSTNEVHEALAGNLCRCTGYRPIVDAAMAMPKLSPGEPGCIVGRAPGPSSDDEFFARGAGRFHAPRTLSDLLALRERHPDAVLWAGGTDLGIDVSKRRRHFERIIWTSRVPQLGWIGRVGGYLRIGAAATYSRALPHLRRYFPAFGELLLRFGSIQIRNLGTIGGNVCTASPIGDTLPALLALDAVLLLRSNRGRRRILAGEFFLDYRRTALVADEVLEAILLPIPGPRRIVRTYKIAKRFDQDIAAVIGAFALDIEGGRVGNARVAFGGMAATPRRALDCEAALEGQVFGESAIEAAAAALEREFAPISDLRAGADYRRRVAGNLLRRLHAEVSRPGSAATVMAL